MPKSIRLGVFESGYFKIVLYAKPGEIGGSFWLLSPNDTTYSIEIGIDEEREQTIYTALLHEILELSLTLQGKRLVPTIMLNPGHDKYVFNFTHTEFSEYIFCVSEFMLSAWPVVRKCWMDYQKKNKKGR